MMEDTMEAYRGVSGTDQEVEKVYFILDGDDDPVQEAYIDDIVSVNDFQIPVELRIE
jgi:hypothetical protein